MRKRFKSIASCLDLVVQHGIGINKKGFKSITIHNFRNGSIPLGNPGRIRFFCSTCECDPTSAEYNVPSRRQKCPRHTTRNTRICRLRELAFKLNIGITIAKKNGNTAVLAEIGSGKGRGWEFIAPPEVEGEEDQRNGSGWKGIEDEMRAKCPIWNMLNVEMRSNGGAESCVCCGNK
ncbi:hypothetical protein I302_105825 [Kwoniella bestiolae CBS 10118]|uniref:Uncharacterized protein n=1 Tax=Kwoniella bestiolae CBS 10118 TaxID=1296100 RepID=A0A1B9G285_9TREE|nr:hypothetical protein I302_04947 [Kwoniella bestiolae CBS 10118]OCF25137.1 hypothetical protein I302_04947 [Kwoniella bestiolae CBS 10118]